MRRRARLVLAPAALVLAVAAPTAGAASLASKLDAALHNGRTSTAAPAATGAVMRCGKLVWSGADGVLDLKSKRPATNKTLFASASTGKPMTAALVMDLVERGKLSLGTKLAKFYPGLPKASAITIRMLLGHRAGFNEYFDDPAIANKIENDPGHGWTRREVLKGITKTRFAPGSKHEYSNSGYVVLGGVIEKVTGKGFARVFRARIRDELAMTNSIPEYRPGQSFRFAHPYTGPKGDLQDMFVPGLGVAADYWGPVWTDGGLATTAIDLARFGDGLFAGDLLKARTVEKMTSLGDDGYGFGVTKKGFGDSIWAGHDGAYVGYEAELWHDASRGITLAVMSNADRSALAIWERVAKAYDQSQPIGATC
jgi:D-alanyl-D-alanine carboxypeptidase